MLYAISKCHNENKNKEVNVKATELYDKWKSMVERCVEMSLNKPTVQYDEETDWKREKSMQFLREAALASGTSKNVFPTQEKLLVSIEQYVFEKVSKKLLNIRYNRTLRKIIFSLRHNEELKQKVLFEKSLTVENFIKIFLS